MKAELRATEAERSVTKLQKEVDRLEGNSSVGALQYLAADPQGSLVRKATVLTPTSAYNIAVSNAELTTYCLWSPYVIGQTIIFLPCSFFLSSICFFFFIPRLIPAATDWMSTILLHMVRP